jgi:hypothetical protein
VTALEQRESEARVQAQKKANREKREREAAALPRSPVEVSRILHDQAKISTDMLSKITAPKLAPPLVKETAMAKAKLEPKTAASPFAGIRSSATRRRHCLNGRICAAP